MIIKIFMNCATILNCPTEPACIKSYCLERNRCDISLKVPLGYLFIDDNDDATILKYRSNDYCKATSNSRNCLCLFNM